jgi:hypothetical protein
MRESNILMNNDDEMGDCSDDNIEVIECTQSKSKIMHSKLCT